jgi:L-rhamnose-H+ transport protein
MALRIVHDSRLCTAAVSMKPSIPITKEPGEESMNPVVGVILHAIGGFAAGSFYIPFKRVRNWAWESYWLVSGVFAWIAAPWVVAWLTVPDLLDVLRSSPPGSLAMTFVFGVLWGIGGLTFGLTMRYLGMSLGYALALGYTAAFGTIVPPIYFGTLGEIASTLSGQVTLGGMVVCLAGIAVCGWAGVSKERELSDAQKKESIREFDFKKGFWIALLCGIMSACFAFALAAGKPIAAQAAAMGAGSLWVNSPVFILVMHGGFITNAAWCIFLNIRNRSTGDYGESGDASLAGNYLFSALAGIIWYCQFMFYGMGTTRMGEYDFSSWTIHMAFIIVFSNVWGLLFREWRGSSGRTLALITTGILVLVASTVIVGYGNYLASLGM